MILFFMAGKGMLSEFISERIVHVKTIFFMNYQGLTTHNASN